MRLFRGLPRPGCRSVAVPAAGSLPWAKPKGRASSPAAPKSKPCRRYEAQMP